MNMISTGAFLNEMDASSKQPTLAEKFAAVWEKKNAKAARAGGVSLMALSLAACGGSSSTTTTDTTDTTTTTDTTPVSSALTTSADALVGGAGSDSFSGLLSGAMATGSTIQSGDSVTGGAGADTLTLYISGDAGAAFTLGGIITDGVETIAISNYDTDTTANGTVIDMSAMSGVTTVQQVNSSATGDTKFDNVQNIVDIIAKGAGDVNVAYTSTVTSGTADSQNATVDTYTGTLTVAGVETLNLTATGGNSTVAAVTAAAATKLTVAGDKNLTITDLTSGSAAVATIDASAMTGKFTVTSADTDLASYTGGSGNDTLVRNNQADDTAATDSFDAGDGVDTLSVTTGAALNAGEAATNLANYSNFERLLLTDASTETAIDLTGVSMFSIIKSSDATNGTTTVNGVAAGTNFEITGMDTTTDNFTAALADDTAADSATITLGTTAAGVTAGTLTFNNHETLTIATQGGASSINSLVGSDLTTLNVEGAKNLTLTNATATSLATLDASGMTGKLIMSNAVGKTTIAITGGSGNDTIVGGSSHNTIDGGAGNDTITSVEGNDTISGGAGNDTIVVDDFSDLSSSDTIDGGDGTDTLKFSEAVDHDFTASSTLLNGVTNIEKYTFSGLNASDTVTINDTVMNNGAITIEFTANVSNDSNQLDASGVLTSTNTVNFTDNSGDVVTYTVGNGIDVVDMGADNDIVLITTEAYASTSDSVSGGVGSDVLRITLNGGSTAATADSIATTALSGYTSFETIQIDDTDTSSYITITLDDDFVSNNELNDALTVAATDGSTAYDGTATIDASGVTLTTVLTLTGGSDTDTIKGGAGADEISGGGGIDTLTGGGGKDDFNFAASSNGLDVITDFDFGTNASTGTQDQLDLSAIATITALTLTDGAIWRQGDTIAAGDNIFIYDDQAYADADAIETAIDGTAAATITGGVIVLWQDTLGKVHLSYDTVAQTDNSGFVDLATLSGHTIGSISSLVDAADFIV